jgi:hypothetical protein
MCQPGGFAGTGLQGQACVAGSRDFYQAGAWLKPTVLAGSSVHRAKKTGVAVEVVGKQTSRGRRRSWSVAGCLNGVSEASRVSLRRSA